MPIKNKNRASQFQLYGWLLFVVCSFFFIADSVIDGNPLGIVGSILFFLGCVVFLIPLVHKRA